MAQRKTPRASRISAVRRRKEAAAAAFAQRRLAENGEVRIKIPMPLSVNGLFENAGKKGRIKTPEYNAWIEEAGTELNMARPGKVDGPYKLCLVLGETKGDPGNFLKAAEDLLVANGVIRDDKFSTEILVKRNDKLGRFAQILILKDSEISL